MSDIKAGRPGSMRDLNKRIVMNIIRREKYISRIELCRIIGLKPPTISNITNELLKENLIVFSGKGEKNKNGGPSPDLYKINREGRYFIGIDINVKGIQGLVLDLEENIVTQAYCDPDYTSQEKLTNNLKSMINTLIKKSKIDLSLIEGIGVGLSALVDANNGIIKGAGGIGILNDYKIKEILDREFSINSFVDNDINLLALGQKTLIEEENELKNVLCLGIRSGIGLGIIIDGKLYRGSEGMSGNVEYFENVETENTIVEKVKTIVKKNGISMISDLGVEKVEDIDINHVCYALQMNNPVILEIVRESCYNLGILAGKLVYLFNPDCFMVSGRILSYNDTLFDYLVSVARDYCKNLHFENVVFINLPLDDTSVAKCAAYRILQNFFNVNNMFF